MADRGNEGAARVEIRRSRAIPAVVVGLLALFAWLGVRAQRAERRPAESVERGADGGEARAPDPAPLSTEPGPTTGPGDGGTTSSEAGAVGGWAEVGVRLEMVLAVGRGADGYELIDLRDGDRLVSALSLSPELAYGGYLIGTTGVGEVRTVSDSLDEPLGEVPSGVGLFRHPDPRRALWTFRQAGSSRREFFVMEERSLDDPAQTVSEVETPVGIVPLITSDGPRFVSSVEGGVYELMADSEVRLLADGLAIGAIGDRVVTWSCDEALSCAVSVSEGPDWDQRRIEGTTDLAGHDGEWSISEDGEWVVLRDVVAPASHLVGLDSGLLVDIDTLGPIVIASDYAFWTRDNRVHFRGLVDGNAGSFEVSGRSKTSGLALGPVEILTRFGAAD